MKRRVYTGLLAILMVLSTVVAPVWAHDEPKKSRDTFSDLAGYEWAHSYVAEMQAKGVMKGTGDGKFEPNQPLTRAQAITAVLRFMGLEAKAQEIASAVTPAMLPYADADKIADWARPYVALATQKQMIPLAEDGLLRSHEKASRLWVSVLLVRALGYESEAQSKMATPLSFQDAAAIPVRLAGYVAAAVDHQLIQGYPDNTFRPNEPLTRAQAAALLSRSDSQLAEQGKLRTGSWQGELKAVDDAHATLTVSVKDHDVNVPVAANAAIFLLGQPANLDDLKVGIKVLVVVGPDGKAVMVAGSKSENKEARREVNGYIVSLVLPTDDESTETGMISLRVSEGGEKSFSLASDVPVRQGDHQMPLEKLQPGDKVHLLVASGVVVGIQLVVSGDKRSESGEIKGMVSAITPATSDSLAKISIQGAKGELSYKVAPGVEVRLGDKRSDLGHVQTGDRVMLKVANGIVLKLRVERP